MTEDSRMLDSPLSLIRKAEKLAREVTERWEREKDTGIVPLKKPSVENAST